MAAAISPDSDGPESLGFVIARARTRFEPVFGKVPVVVIPVDFDEKGGACAGVGVARPCRAVPVVRAVVAILRRMAAAAGIAHFLYAARASVDGCPAIELAPEKGRRAYGDASLCPAFNPECQPQCAVCVQRKAVEHLRGDLHAKDSGSEYGLVVKAVLCIVETFRALRFKPKVLIRHRGTSAARRAGEDSGTIVQREIVGLRRGCDAKKDCGCDTAPVHYSPLSSDRLTGARWFVTSRTSYRTPLSSESR